MGISNSRCAANLLWAVSLLCSAWPAASRSQSAPEKQAAPPPADSPFRLKARVEMVDVPVSVSDARGAPVENLQQKNFRVFADGAEQALVSFTPVQEPALVFLLVETSPAVYLLQSQHITAAHALFDGLAPEDQLALAVYSDVPRMALPFTPDKRAVQQALQVFSAQYGLGFSRLNFLDSLATALDWLRPIPGKKSLVLLSTGLDGSGALRRNAVLEALRGSEVAVFPIALGGSLRESPGRKPAPPASEPGMSFVQADRDLQAIAAASGGRAFFPKTAGEFPAIYRQLAALLRHQYRLGFAPAHDGKFHLISVQLVDERGHVLAPAEGKRSLRISFRPGYVAPEER